MPRNAENQRTCYRADPGLTRPTILPLRYPKVGMPLGKVVKSWSNTVWASTVVVFVGGMELHAQTSPACIVVEIPTDPSDLLPNKTSPDLDRLYAKADTEKSSVAILPSGRTGPAKKGSGGQDEIAVTLSVREKEFLSSQPWWVYCPLNVVSQPAPPTLDAHQTSHLSSRETARPRIAPTRVAFTGHYGQTNMARRVRGRVHSHYQAQVRSIGRHHSGASAGAHKRA
jgi:hypothetical protein